MAESTVLHQSKCQLVFLGKTGLKVSNLCLGTLTFGQSRTADFLKDNLQDEAAYQLMERFAQWGGNFLDTADFYGPSTSEIIVGNWLQRQDRERFVVATKVGMPTDPANPHKVGLSRRHITQAVQDSLGRLQTNFIDLYQTHLWDIAVPLEETLRTLNDLVRCGKVRYLGASNLSGWQMERYLRVQEKLGLEPVVSLQQYYSLHQRFSELEAFQVCKGSGVGVLPWSPLSFGLLSGKFTRYTLPDTGRMATMTSAFPRVWADDQLWNILDVTKRIAESKGKSQAQVALRWLLQKDFVASVIIGVRTLQQLDDNMGAANGWTLTPEEMAELDKVSQPEKPYPYRSRGFDLENRINPFNPPTSV
ncbi:uncharacterized protein LOC112565384 [Pomacea canaliculata]|uniref:uncharacterized protein LOC112565384 n=1 Tax=Pomacea canaliculata TaxID=400727 RepID=UPI000D7306FC|nr:uncharacterized protein LOC112565384 [Pomacea canaliculata]